MKLVALLAVLLVATPLTAQSTNRSEQVAADTTSARRFAFRFAFRFNPDFVRQQAAKVNLERRQSRDISTEVGTSMATFRRLTAQLHTQQRLLDSVLEHSRVDEAAALRALDGVIRVESMLKRLRLQLLIRTKNVLTPEQQQQLRQIDEVGQ